MNVCKCGHHPCSHIVGHFGNECAVCDCKALDPAIQLRSPEEVAAALVEAEAKLKAGSYWPDRAVDLATRIQVLKWVLKMKDML